MDELNMGGNEEFLKLQMNLKIDAGCCGKSARYYACRKGDIVSNFSKVIPSPCPFHSSVWVQYTSSQKFQH